MRFGRCLGLANPGDTRAVVGTRFRPVLAQQSIRELLRTTRTPEEVIDAATWAVLQEGFREGFSSDADHLKTENDIHLMMKAGFTMFTFDPSAFVVNKAETAQLRLPEQRASSLPWEDLSDTYQVHVSV